MSLSDILTMRNELLLTVLAMILLTIDLNVNHFHEAKKEEERTAIASFEKHGHFCIMHGLLYTAAK